MKSNFTASVVPCHSYEIPEVRSAQETAIKEIGGWDSFLASGDKVLLKPNCIKAINIQKHPALTHANFIEALCETLSDRNIKIYLGDSPAFGSIFQLSRAAGYDHFLKRFSIQLIPFRTAVKKPTGKYSHFSSLPLAKEALEMDKIINLPKLKAHIQMKMTLAVKNLFGCIVGKRKPLLHCRVKNKKIEFAKMLLDLGEALPPTLHLLDGIIAMEGKGPINGTPRSTGFLMASKEALAIDAGVCELLHLPLEEHYITQAALETAARGFRQNSLQWINPPPESLYCDDFQFPFEMDISFHPWKIFTSFVKQGIHLIQPSPKQESLQP